MEWLKISTSTELVRVQTNDIIYVKASGNYSDLNLVNGKTITMTFKLHFFDEAFKKLENNTFVRVGKSHIVNKKYVGLINLTEQVLILYGYPIEGERRISASKEALKDLKALVESEQVKSL